MTAINRRLTAYQIIKRVLQEIGLPVPTTIAGSSDTLAVQFFALLNSCGQELLGIPGGWEFFTKTYTFVTTPPTLNYALPSDYEYFIPNTGWNNTARIPLGGPMTPQQWQLLQVRQLGGTTLQLQYVIRADQLQFYALPTVAQTISMSYYGRGWVQDAADSTIFKDTVEADGDLVLYDPVLAVAMLTWKWRDKKGFDTSSDEKSYQRALAAAKSKEPPGQDLNLSKRGSGTPYLGVLNLPETGYGS